MWPYFDAVALAHGHPHGEGGGRDAAEDVQQGQTETLSVLAGGHTGEAGEAPVSKTTCRWTTGRRNIAGFRVHSDRSSSTLL